MACKLSNCYDGHEINLCHENYAPLGAKLVELGIISMDEALAAVAYNAAVVDDYYNNYLPRYECH